MNDLWQCYTVGLVTGVTLMCVPVAVLHSLLKRERERNYWFRWWQQHETKVREGRR